MVKVSRELALERKKTHLASEFLLVDGYNIIFAWDKLKKLAEENLDDARDKLIDIMSNYQGYKKCNVIVVFDAHKVKGSVRKIYQYYNVEVVFTKEAETADHFIERVAHEIGRDYRVRVATSDALEQTIILSKGATRISAREFENEVKNMEEIIRHRIIEDRPVKENLLSSHLKPEVAEFMEKLRRQ